METTKLAMNYFAVFPYTESCTLKLVHRIWASYLRHTYQSNPEEVGKRARPQDPRSTSGSGTLFVIPAVHPPILLEFAGNRLLSRFHQVKLSSGYSRPVPKQDSRNFDPIVNVVDEEWSRDTALERRRSACLLCMLTVTAANRNAVLRTTGRR